MPRRLFLGIILGLLALLARPRAQHNVPKGSILPWAGAQPPNGWMLIAPDRIQKL